MSYVLDTDTIIYFLKGQPAVTTRILSTKDLAITRITATELLYGAYNSARQQQNLQIIYNLLEDFTVLEFDAIASEYFARHKSYLKKNGILLADMDLMIASICLAGNHTLVTNNTRHFECIVELVLENWTN